MKRNLSTLKLAAATLMLSAPWDGMPRPFDTPSQPIPSQPAPKKELSKYDLEALKKAQLKRERKTKDR